jgi:hypothetical protein
MQSDELPPVYEGTLDGASCEALFEDLGRHGRVVEVSVKQGARVRADEQQAWTLAQALSALQAGTVRAVQVRYVHEGVLWLDTILRTATAFRIVRMQAPVPV